MSMPLTQLHGVYDHAGSDRAYGRLLKDYIGATFTYLGSDGQRHRGHVKAVCDGHELWDGIIAVYSCGYSDGHWIPLDRVAFRLDN